MQGYCCCGELSRTAATLSSVLGGRYARILFDSYFLLELCQHQLWLMLLAGFALAYVLMGIPVVLYKVRYSLESP